MSWAATTTISPTIALRTANRLRDLLLQASPAVDASSGRALSTRAVPALLKRYPTPSAMRAAGKRCLLRLVARARHGSPTGSLAISAKPSTPRL